MTRTGDPVPWGKTVMTTGDPFGDPDPSEGLGEPGPFEPPPTVTVATPPEAGAVAEGV